MALNFPLIGAMAPTASQLPPAAKRDWRASLFDRLMPDDGLEDPDKEAAIRQGLLGLASGLLGTGGGFGNALSAGIQGGLLATNQSVDDQADRAYKKQLMDQRMGDPAGLREFQALAEAAGYKPGSDDYQQAARTRLGTVGRASSAGFSQVEFVDGEGRPRIGAFNGRTGQIDLPDGTSWSPQTGYSPTMQAQSGPLSGTPFTIDPSLPPQVQAAIRGNEQAWAQAPDMGTMQVPQARPMAANPFVGRRAEDEAAAVAAAQERAKLSMLPTRNRLEAQGAGMSTAAQEKARIDAEFAAYDQMVANEENTARRMGAVKNEVEQSAKQTEKDAALRLYEAGMTGVTDGLGQANTGPLIGRLPAVTTEQQIAQGGVAAIAPVLKQLFRTAGEGTFTDKDQELLMQMIPTRIDTPESIEWKLQNIDRIVKAKLNAAPDAGALESLSDEDLLRQLGGM